MVGGDLELIVEADENSGRSEHRHAAAFACIAPLLIPLGAAYGGTPPEYRTSARAGS